MYNQKFFSLLLAAALALTACSRDRAVFDAARATPNSSMSETDPLSDENPDDEPDPDDDSREDILLSESTADLLRSGTYYMTCTSVIQMEDLRLENSVTVAVDGENSIVKTTSDLSGALTTVGVLTLDGVTWMINETMKTCVKVDPSESAGGFDTDFSGLTFEERGEGEFDAEILPFEQYDQQGDTIRFFFGEDDRLYGITRSIHDDQLAEMTLRVKTISGNIPAKTIAIPEGYKV